MFNAEYVIDERKKQGLTVKDMAERLGIPVSVYEAYETKQKVPSSTYVMLIAKELQLDYKNVRGENVEVSVYVKKEIMFDGDKLLELRTKNGLSRLKLAHELSRLKMEEETGTILKEHEEEDLKGVSRKAIDNWEHNSAEPMDDNVRLLEKYFCVPQGYFRKEF